METHLLVSATKQLAFIIVHSMQNIKIAITLLALIFSTTNSVARESDDHKSNRQDIRFYKINKDNITQKIRFTKRKARKPGCHNFIKKVRLHRTVQIAYKQCQVFAKKNCAADSVISFFNKEEPDLHSTELSQGYGWYPVGQNLRGEKVKSWSCQ